ncbi:MAG: hypothetical protein ABUK01_15770 [Leptospirales bacterium]
MTVEIYKKIFENFGKTLSEISDSLSAIYNTITVATDFIGAIFGWFGFSTIAVLLGILFIYKIISILLPRSPGINLGISFLAFTALWISWNLAIYQSLELLAMGKTYGFIGLHIGVVYLLHYIISKIVEKIKGRVQNRKISKADVIELYDTIDQGVVVIKQNLRTGNKQGAKDAFATLQKQFSGFLG